MPALVLGEQELGVEEIDRREKPKESHAARSITMEEISTVHRIRWNGNSHVEIGRRNGIRLVSYLPKHRNPTASSELVFERLLATLLALAFVPLHSLKFPFAPLPLNSVLTLLVRNNVEFHLPLLHRHISIPVNDTP